jgi:hypothetical protein
MKLIIVCISLYITAFGLIAAGMAIERGSFANTPEYQKRIDVLKKSCIKSYRDKDGFTRYSGCRLGEINYEQ